MFEIFNKELITEVNVDKLEDNYYYKGYKFNYLEEPYFIKQIFTDIDLKDTDLIKELEEEIEYYKDKIIEEKEELYNYSKTNSILNKYKFELEDGSDTREHRIYAIKFAVMQKQIDEKDKRIQELEEKLEKANRQLD